MHTISHNEAVLASLIAYALSDHISVWSQDSVSDSHHCVRTLFLIILVQNEIVISVASIKPSFFAVLDIINTKCWFTFYWPARIEDYLSIPPFCHNYFLAWFVMKRCHEIHKENFVLYAWLTRPQHNTSSYTT